MKYKKCSKCKLLKPISEFHKDKYKKDGLTCWCKDCKRKYGRKYHKKNKLEICRKASIYFQLHKKEKQVYDRIRDKKRYIEFKKLLIQLRVNGCAICGSHINLEFHHVTPEDKIFKISDGSRYDYETFMKEFYKCMLLCSKCHGKVHKKYKSNK